MSDKLFDVLMCILGAALFAVVMGVIPYLVLSAKGMMR